MEGGAPASIKMIYIYIFGTVLETGFSRVSWPPRDEERADESRMEQPGLGEVKKVLMASLIPGNRSGEWSTNFHLFAAPSPVCLDSLDARNHRSFEGSIKN